MLFRFAVEHDCLKSNCPIRSLRPRKQERQVTSKMAYGVDHVDDEHFVINLLSLHNPHLIREILPPMLTQPRRIFEDREAHIEQMVRKLQTESNQCAMVQWAKSSDSIYLCASSATVTRGGCSTDVLDERENGSLGHGGFRERPFVAWQLHG